ncbi:hypothetical protein SD70_01090 [Gordoniibacillus kamchatkensis]|uniref:Spore germination protein gerPA/gerPF n=1 Tax=Gordoniibacillus kamchatkensis TaxID=1590651 RepID=A0ABR5ANU1_9BACL|nr:hypothetical protein [Paenibacillus sp. VKM B-2647]KIL42513.1 hypothetical protein SD70_01090 [Paenibacillus sp. VKM B-2647]
MPAPAPQIVININIIKVNSFENASAINVGQNLLAEWHNSDKKTMGIGQNMGDGTSFVGTKSFVDDRDQFDSNSTFTSDRIPVPIAKGSDAACILPR